VFAVAVLGLFAAGETAALAQAPDQPFASYWFPNDLPAWSPDSDDDAAFNRSNTPLAARVFNPDLNVNPHARPNEAGVMALSAFGPTSRNPSQGSLSISYYAVNYWQYIEVLVFWGGSAGEGLILAPNPTIIDAAHRNGVPVVGNIFFPPTVFGGQIQWVRDLVQQSEGTFPVADKLIEVARYYGFDGWFINQETSGGDPALATQMVQFIEYIKASSDLQMLWYDAMTINGNIAYQNALNGNNALFFDHDGVVSDGMFLNYNWSAPGLSNSRSYAQNLGRSPYALYAGANVQANGYNSNIRWDSVFPEGQPHVVSIGFYRPDWTFNSSSDPDDFYRRDNRFWVGANRDPSNTETTHPWKGLAHYLPARSPIVSLPFVTNFNTGQGHLYAIDGDVLMTHDWNNLSVQDVLPTWRWIVQSDGSKLVPDLDWSDAYYGGTSLKIAGVLDAPNLIKLYQSSLPVSADTQLRTAYKLGSPGVPTQMSVAIAFEDNPDTFETLEVGSSSSAGWETAEFSLSSFAGRTIAVIALRFDASDPVYDYEIRVGQIAVYDPIGPPAPPSGLVVQRMTRIDPNRATLRLGWEHSSDPIVSYNVFRRNPDGSSTYLGGTPNNAYFVAEIERVDSEGQTTIEVQAVGPTFAYSPSATTRFDWE
jgi:mannosyl-glycoprotein endo-beta-N-acetylglucosaminidase